MTPSGNALPWRRLLLVAGFFILLTCAMTWPLANLSAPRLPDSDDAYFSVWRIAWVSHQIARDPFSLFDANIFVPAKGTLAFSDAMLALGVMAWPLIALGLHPAVVHNLLLIAGFAAAGVGAFLLCRELSGSTGAALIGGIIFAFAPFRFGHIGHLELLWTAPMPLVLLVLHRALADPKPVKHGTMLGCLLALQAFCSVYYAVFLAIFLVAWTLLVFVLRGTPDRRMVQVVVLGGAIALGLVAPYGSTYLKARGELGPRPAAEIQSFSAVASDYLRVSFESQTYPPGPAAFQDERSLFPGLTAVVLALVALRKPRTWLVVLFGVLAVLTFDLSRGLNGVSYRALGAALPMLDGLRAPARFFSLVLLTLSVLAALGFSGLTRSLATRTRAAATAIAAALCLIEYFSAPVNVRAPTLDPPAVYQWLNVAKPRAIIELPLPAPSTLWLFESTHQYMSIFHWTPLVNGYSGNAPRSYFQTLEAMQSFPSEESIARLKAAGVEHVIVHQNNYDPVEFDALMTTMTASTDFGPPLKLADVVGSAWVFPIIYP